MNLQDINNLCQAMDLKKEKLEESRKGVTSITFKVLINEENYNYAYFTMQQMIRIWTEFKVGDESYQDSNFKKEKSGYSFEVECFETENYKFDVEQFKWYRLRVYNQLKAFKSDLSGTKYNVEVQGV